MHTTFFVVCCYFSSNFNAHYIGLPELVRVYPARAPHGRRPPTGSGMITYPSNPPLFLLFLLLSTLYFFSLGGLYISFVCLIPFPARDENKEGATTHKQLTQQRKEITATKCRRIVRFFPPFFFSFLIHH